MKTRWWTFALVILILQGLAGIAEGQKKEITKEEYDRAFENAQQATTYPYRETVEFKSFTYYDSPEALYADEGEEILSQVAVTEFSRPDRLRTTVTTETEKGKRVVQLMQFESDCYAFVGTRWKKVQSCNSMDLTIGMRPQKEEFFVETTKLNGVDVRAFLRAEISGPFSIEMGFYVDQKGRMVRREHPDKTSTYEYGVKIKPITRPKG